MLLVIVGAGASFDAVEHGDVAWRMPLVSGLFDSRGFNKEALQAYPLASSIVSELRVALNNGVNSVEEALAVINDEARGDIFRRQQLLALRLYLRRTILNSNKRVIEHDGRITSYSILISKLRKYLRQKQEQILIVDFNYDALLEDAIINGMGFKLIGISHYMRNNAVKLIKPHGSIKWFRKPEIDNPNIKISNANDLIDHINWFDVEEGEIFVKENWENPNLIEIPVLAVPIKNKNSFACPDFMIKSLESLIPSTTKLVTIGWRGAEEHFKEFLKKIPTPPKALIVGETKKGTEEVSHNLSGLIQYPSYYDSGFGQFVASGALEEFLTGTT